ncbi:c4926b7f-13bc-4ba7-8934-62c6c1fdbdab [Sclerotinia trifoliorum]|uniref:C4926b7f-13bc-4ba7-8934-62c6c1fdbdab n=1 Tax=Sclerotinia trifoliorum TaxID=28548 RepID=A0A8H2VX23_9HELO|nr:c4926b7f-13bc-4ba7-8934-62c6c1fdbdab [Sclerotinia trifoliorum]
MDFSKPMNIVIIGGSNTGLMHGVMLSHLPTPHQITILERNPSDIRPDLAAGITTWPEFEDFMKHHDRVDEAWSIHSPGVQFLDKDANVKRKMDKPLKMTSWSVIYHRLRRNFDGLSSEFCDGEVRGIGEEDEGIGKGEGKGKREFLTGMSVTSLTKVEDGVEITYEDLKDSNREHKLKADMVILADGANSTLRAKFFPDVKREYAGYVAFRGTVPESEVSAETKSIFDPNLTYFSYKGGYILLYIIPSSSGSLAHGDRRYNWVWYHPVSSSTPSFNDLMTDTMGVQHRTTLPAGLMNPTAWSPYLTLSQSVMTAPFAEVISKTPSPFITAINDSTLPQALIPGFDNRVLITGEALNLMRPHMALSTTQSAMQALLLERVFKGEMGLQEWEKRVLKWGRLGQCKTNAFGLWNLRGLGAALPWVLRLVGVLVGVL